MVTINPDILGLVAATLTTACFIPQAVKAIRTRHTKDISFLMYVLFSAGVSLWLVYGLLLMKWPIILSNALTLPLALIILFIKWREG